MDTVPLPPYQPPARRKRRTGLVIALVAAGLLVSVALCGIGAAIGMNAGGKDDAPAPAKSATPTEAPTATPTEAPPRDAPAAGAAVPKVVGARLTDARRTLEAAGFDKLKAEDATGQGRVVLNEANWVVRTQRPAAGTRADPGAEVVLAVAKPTDAEPAPVTAGVVPGVVCRDLQAAQDLLQEAGFRVLASEDGTGQDRRQLVDRNWLVIRQSAAPGSRPAAATRITLTVVKYGEPTGDSGCKS